MSNNMLFLPVLLWGEFLLQLADAFFWGWKVLRHGAAKVFDCLPDGCTDIEMGFIGGFFAFDIFTAQLRLCLSGSEQVGSQFLMAHVVKYLLVFL